MAEPTPIRKGWVSTTGETGAQNYDEFADDAEITAIVEANPRSMLAVEMAHCTQEMLADGADRERSLRHGAERLQRLKDDGLLAPAQDFAVAYEIDAPTGRQLGIGLMAPTAEIWDAERNPGGRIIRNEDVFPEKVEYYADVIRAVGHLPSAVMLAAPDADAAVRDAVEEVVRSRPPTVTSRDQKGNEHRVHVVSGPAERDRLLASLEGKELLVADGNHRSRASEHAGLDAFLAVVLSAETMHIDEYHRGFRELPIGDDEFLARVREAGFDVDEAGMIELFSRNGHRGLTPRFEVALGMPAVTMADFVAVNERRLKMPRKSTWFTPKLRAGLVVVEL